jgi:hypothetical protein
VPGANNAIGAAEAVGTTKVGRWARNQEFRKNPPWARPRGMALSIACEVVVLLKIGAR